MTKNKRKLLTEIIDTALAIIISSHEIMTIAITNKGWNKETTSEIYKRQDSLMEKLEILKTKFVG